MSVPTDGYGVYESVNPSVGAATYGPRLQAIAQAGFKLVMNYSLLGGSNTDMIGYINYAAGLGLKVIVALHDPAIWKNNTIATTFPNMYASSGNLATDNGFTSYVVNQVKGLAGTWGYYVGDEVTNADTTAMHNHCGFVRAADSIKPRLMIAGGNHTNAVASGTNLFFDCCEVLGDDYYNLGLDQFSDPPPVLTLAQQASAIQSFDTSNALQSAIVLQAYSFTHYSGTGPWPDAWLMRNNRDTAVATMTPRVVLWFSWFDAIGAPAGQRQQNALAWAVGNVPYPIGTDVARKLP